MNNNNIMNDNRRIITTIIQSSCTSNYSQATPMVRHRYFGACHQTAVTVRHSVFDRLVLAEQS